MAPEYGAEKQLGQDGGNKWDGGKARVDLVDPLLMISAAKGMAFGARPKEEGGYGENNWRQGIKQSRLYGALLRHLYAYWQGENKDPDSGNDHLDHAACMLMMLIRHSKDINYIDMDDRPYYSIKYKQDRTRMDNSDLTPSDSERPTRDLSERFTY